MAQTEEQQFAMFGTTTEIMMHNFELFNPKGDLRGMLMTAIGTLSDAQERIALGVATDEDTRQALNRAKYFMSEVMVKLPRN